jgi:hypothetical protein
MKIKMPQVLHSKKKNISECPVNAVILFDRRVYFRSSSLAQVNTILRDQLDQAHLANQQLSEDLRSLANELHQVREELTKKTKDWKEDERVS